MKLTLDELIELRLTIPPVPTDFVGATLADRFLIPPFSVLNARQGYWQKRKKMWIELGIQSELGRGVNSMGMSATIAGIVPGSEEHAKWLETQRIHGQRRPKKDNGLLNFSEQARSGYAVPGGSLLPSAQLRKDGKTQRGDGRGRAFAESFNSGAPGELGNGFKKSSKNKSRFLSNQKPDTPMTDAQEKVMTQSGTSIFDPVLCELVYRWFSSPSGHVLDPFAGGSVRGIVAASLGRSYAGIDLRPEQVEANYAQYETIVPDGDITWVEGDAVDVRSVLGGEYDFILSCPPYADLERYSYDPRDLSTLDYPSFLTKYRAIIAESCAMLKQDRFACFVVGDVRNQDTGIYRGLPGDTIQAFRDCGLELYNEAILVTAVGSLPIRVGYQFAKYRKFGRTHQHVLVFIKGDPARAVEACGEVDVDDLAMPDPGMGRVALSLRDAIGTIAEDYLTDEGLDAPLVELPPTEAYLLADIVRGQARLEEKPIPRCWIGTDNGWQRVEDRIELTYIVDGVAYLNRTVFPTAVIPIDQPPPPKRFRE